MADVRDLQSLDPDTVAAVRALAAAVQEATGAPPLSDQALSRLTADGVRHLLLFERDTDDRPAGYAQCDGTAGEVLARTVADAGALVDALGNDTQQVWSHGTGSTVAPALDKRGWHRSRVLHRLRRPLCERYSPKLPDGVHLRGFVPDQDETAVLRVNARAFADHPEQGSWTETDIRAREAEDWFEAAGVLLAERTSGPAPDLLGFHWTKMHPGRVGEVYVLAVDPDAQGLHLGSALLDAGLDHLAARGAQHVILYVDDDNARAMNLYERAGFLVDDTDVQWTRSADLSSTG